MYNSLPHNGLQHARLPCPSPTPGACWNSCLSSRWFHSTISSSVIPFSSHLQSFLASGSFPRSPFFTSSGQGIGVSASASVLPINIQDWLPLGWTGWISLQFKGLLRVFSNTTIQKQQFFGTQLPLLSNSHLTSTHDCWKKHSFDQIDLVGKVNCLCFIVCCLGWSQLFFQGASIFYFHGCSHHLQWFWSPPKNKVSHSFYCFPIYLHKVMWLEWMPWS